MAKYISPQTGEILIDLHGRSLASLGSLARSRLEYSPRYPKCLSDPSNIVVRAVTFAPLLDQIL